MAEWMMHTGKTSKEFLDLPLEDCELLVTHYYAQKKRDIEQQIKMNPFISKKK